MPFINGMILLKVVVLLKIPKLTDNMANSNTSEEKVK
jgi:hypothetical protein